VNVWKENELCYEHIMNNKTSGHPGKGLAVLECYEEIPCDPCRDICPFGAISIPGLITDIPQLDRLLCTGCGRCIPACPGQAIFIITYLPDEKKARISLPYEFLPYPTTGQKGWGLDRKGRPVCRAKVISLKLNKDYDHTAVLTIEIPSWHAREVRFFRRSHDDN